MPGITGRKSAIGTTALALIGTATPVTYATTIKAAAANTGKIYVGLAGVTADSAEGTDGLELAAGEAVSLPKQFAADASLIFLIGSAASQKVFFVVI